MTASSPAPEEAREALAEADRRAMGGHLVDRQYRPILLGLAAAYLAAGVLVGLFPRGGSMFAGVGLIVIVIGSLAGALALVWRFRVYSRWGPLRFAWSCVGFVVWNTVVVGVSSTTGWWGPHQPGVHFTISAAVAAISLVFAAWLLGNRR